MQLCSVSAELPEVQPRAELSPTRRVGNRAVNRLFRRGVGGEDEEEIREQGWFNALFPALGSNTSRYLSGANPKRVGCLLLLPPESFCLSRLKPVRRSFTWAPRGSQLKEHSAALLAC